MVRLIHMSRPVITPFRCGSDAPPAEILAQAQSFADNTKAAPQPQAHTPIVVNTYFHVVTSPAKQGLYTQTQLNNEVRSR